MFLGSTTKEGLCLKRVDLFRGEEVYLPQTRVVARDRGLKGQRSQVYARHMLVTS